MSGASLRLRRAKLVGEAGGEANQAVFPVAVMAMSSVCRKPGYAWRDRASSARQVADEALLGRVQDVHAASRNAYGAPRVHAALKAKGERHGRCAAPALWAPAIAAAAPTPTRRDEEARPAPDLVDRNSKAQAPDQLWVADITYVPRMSGFISPSCSTSSAAGSSGGPCEHLRTEPIVNALDKAVGQRRPKDASSTLIPRRSDTNTDRPLDRLASQGVPGVV